MDFQMGYTRFVILTETEAFKIALPFRPLTPLWIVLTELLRGSLKKKLKKHHGNLFQIALRFMTYGGIDANRREIRISREHPEYPIVPVLRSYLWGLVIVMPRVQLNAEIPGHWVAHSKLLPPHLQKSDLFYKINTGLVAGIPCFLDYGDPSAEEILPRLFAR